MEQSAQPRTGIALIGAGMIAKTHVAALAAARDIARLEVVISRTPSRATYLTEFYDHEPLRFSSDLDAVARDPSIQIAIVATPPSVRAEVITRLAKAGKHILLEKPVARTISEAEEIVQICEAAGVSLGMLFQHRTRPPARAAARHVASGDLGRLGLVEIEVPLWRAQSYYDELGRGTYARDGGGVMITNAIHSIDLALSLTGPVCRVHGMSATTPLHQMEAEDFAVAGLEFANGAKGSFVASTAMFPHRTEVIRLHFENGSLCLDKDKLLVDWRDGRSSVEAKAPPAPPEDPLAGKHEWHQAVIEDFVAAIREGRPPMATGRAALASHRFIEAIESSSRLGAPVEL